MGQIRGVLIFWVTWHGPLYQIEPTQKSKLRSPCLSGMTLKVAVNWLRVGAIIAEFNMGHLKIIGFYQ